MPITVAGIYSTLGNPSSLIPLAIKDVSATAGMTAGSYLTGKEEGRDRLIDEVGTTVIWLLGIPFAKKLFDLGVFKPLKMNPKFDARNLKNDDVFEKIKKYAPDDVVKNDILKIEKNKKLYKNLTVVKFLTSTFFAVTSYIALTRFKQNYTEKKIRENLIAEYNKNTQPSEKNEDNNNESVSFKGVGKAIEYFAFDPVRNMYLLDGCITGERLIDSRSPQELAGYAIKEGATLCFMYYAGGKIQSLMEKSAEKKHNKSIALDARILEKDDFKTAFKDGSIKKSIEEFDKIAECSNNLGTTKNPAELYEFLVKNPSNIIVKSAKYSGLIKEYKKTGKIDTRIYIDLNNVEKMNENIKKLYAEYKDAIANGETNDKFFKKVRGLKRHSVLMNIGSCILALGVITPAIMLLKRFNDKSGEEFQTKKEIREQLINEGIIS